jgi:hypothetical protein
MSTDNTHGQENSLTPQHDKDNDFTNTKLNPVFDDLIAPETILDHFQELKKKSVTESHATTEVESKKLERAEFRKKYLIDVREEIPPPKIAWGLKNILNDKVAILGTLGNFSLVIGKAKAKKSFFIIIAIACALVNEYILNRLIGSLPNNQNQVLYIDTEQGKYHVQLAVRRICRLLNVEIPPNLLTYHLRALSSAERLQFVEEEIYSNDKIGIVVIDGIKDLVTSINDEAEATLIASKLLKWTEERNIHIITVLHQNKNDNNARGHIGTELINKAETVLSITKEESNPNVSTMKPEFCKNLEPEPFSFEIDENGLPNEAIGFEPNIKKEKGFDIYSIENHKLYQLLNGCFAKQSEITYTDLYRKIKIACSTQLGFTIGDNKAKDILTICKEKGWLLQSEKKKPYTLQPFDEG